MTAIDVKQTPAGGKRQPKVQAGCPDRGGTMAHYWLAALRQGTHPMPATIAVVCGCVAVWTASLVTGGAAVSGSVHGVIDHDLARNAALIASGQW